MGHMMQLGGCQWSLELHHFDLPPVDVKDLPGFANFKSWKMKHQQEADDRI